MRTLEIEPNNAASLAGLATPSAARSANPSNRSPMPNKCWRSTTACRTASDSGDYPVRPGPPDEAPIEHFGQLVAVAPNLDGGVRADLEQVEAVKRVQVATRPSDRAAEEKERSRGIALAGPGAPDESRYRTSAVARGLDSRVRRRFVVELRQQGLDVVQVLLRRLQPSWSRGFSWGEASRSNTFRASTTHMWPKISSSEEAAIRHWAALLRRQLADHRLLQVMVDFLHDLGELTGRAMLAHARHLVMVGLAKAIVSFFAWPALALKRIGSGRNCSGPD